jgi:hypothetical protein
MKDKNVTFMILFRYIKYMLKNPFVNALLAGGYIVGGVLVMSTIIEGISGVEDTIIIPMTMLSLLVLSVAVMGGLFFFEPIRLLLENKSYEALSFFIKTLATFFCFVAVMLFLLVYTSIL